MSRLIEMSDVEGVRDYLESDALKVVAVNGCFDVLHIGHLKLLKFAKAQGKVLWVGINSDASVRQLKGESRPYNSEENRAEMLLALREVDFVTIFPQCSATLFIAKTRPDVYVKGGDYNLKNINAHELIELQTNRTKILFSEFVENQSTTRILNHGQG